MWNWPNETKPNPENCKNCSSKCAYDCAQLQYTIQHRTVLIISPHLQTTIIAQILSIGGEGEGAIRHIYQLEKWWKSDSLLSWDLGKWRMQVLTFHGHYRRNHQQHHWSGDRSHFLWRHRCTCSRSDDISTFSGVCCDELQQNHVRAGVAVVRLFNGRPKRYCECFDKIQSRCSSIKRRTRGCTASNVLTTYHHQIKQVSSKHAHFYTTCKYLM